MANHIDSMKKRVFVDGLDISEATADEAADWLTLIMSEDVTAEDQANLLRWRNAHPDHEQAWVHIERTLGQLKGLDLKIAYNTLSLITHQDSPEFSGKRKAIHTLFWVGAAGISFLAISRTSLIKQQIADYRTGIGELRNIQLDDGTLVTLNTATAINVQFNTDNRIINLIAGEIMIVTGHKPNDTRPFVVQTAEGTVRALGTRFSVYQKENHTRVAVWESAVEVSLQNAATTYQRIQAGELLSFTRAGMEQVSAVTAQSSAWMRGQIVADEMLLGDFLNELSRYRPGIIRCDPTVANLRFSGVFPLRDTDQILSVLPNVLPVKVNSRTQYWITVTARDKNN